MQKAQYINIAYTRAKEGMEIHDPSTAKVEYEERIVIVTFPVPHNEDEDHQRYPGADHLARVKIDRDTGEVIEILGSR